MTMYAPAPVSWPYQPTKQESWTKRRIDNGIRQSFQDYTQAGVEADEEITLILNRVVRPLASVTRMLLDIPIPSELNDVADAIEQSRDMLTWPENWDGEGSPAYSEATWDRSVAFLLRTTISLWRDCEVRVATPAIHNGPQGSIDVYWELADRKLLINVPQNVEEPISFYGHVSGSSNEMKGSLRDSDTKLWLMLMMWLMN